MVYLEAAAPEIAEDPGVGGEVESQAIRVQRLAGLAVAAVGPAVAVFSDKQP